MVGETSPLVRGGGGGRYPLSLCLRQQQRLPRARSLLLCALQRLRLPLAAEQHRVDRNALTSPLYHDLVKLTDR